MRLDEAAAVKVGSTDVAAVYAGSEQIWPASAAFTSPLDIGWTHAGWVGGPLFGSPSDAADITTWPNETGGPTPASPGAPHPTFDADGGPSSGPAVAFGGSSYLTVDIDDIAQPWSLFVVGRSASDGNDYYHGIGVGGSFVGGLRRNSNRFGLTAGSVLQAAAGAGDAGWHRFRCYGNGASSQIDVDGTVVAGNAGTAAIEGIQIGQAGLNSHITGAILFWGIYTGDLTADPLWPDLASWADDLIP